ncbi:MAG TPA: hypothetical protein VGE21_00740 [Flavobacteriales bacterium]
MRAFLLCAFLGSSAIARLCAQPYWGTIFMDPDIIGPDDPSTLVSVTYVDQGMEHVWDYRIPGWVDIDAYRFAIVWDDGLTSVAVVNPEFTLEQAEMEANIYAHALGKVPTCLRDAVDELWIHAGVYSFGGGNNAIVIHTGRGQEYIDDGILEEAFVHEGTHASLDAAHANASGWLAAQVSDGGFISTYAQGSPTTEDLAESVLPWLAARYRSTRISATDLNTITTTIPARLAYIDGIACDMYPVTMGTSVDEQQHRTGVVLYPSPASEWLALRSDGPLPAGTRLELIAADGRPVRSQAWREGERLSVADLPPGLYAWRCAHGGRLLGTGLVAVVR